MSDNEVNANVATLRATLQQVEAQLARGTLPTAGLEDLKSAVDDIRFRLWGVLTSENAQEYQFFRERFRIRRATEICFGLATDLDAGTLTSKHEELPDLAGAALQLAARIQNPAGKLHK
jgi:hypothetical protein